MIEISHLRKEFPEGVPLKDISVTIEDGDVVALIGPSGTGKSTLLRCINLLERPTSGSIVVDGTEILDPSLDVTWLRKRVGMVFQSFNLFAHLTAVENVMRPQIDVLRRSRQEAYDKAMALLDKVGLKGHALKYPDELSGGQRQRVAIARALAMDPKTILLDEPTSALDPTMVGEVEAVIRDLAADGTTMVIVTHELSFAAAVSTRVLFLEDGYVVEDGPTEEVFEHPKHEATRRFIKKVKTLRIEIDEGFDYLGASTDIAAYCSKNLIPRKMTHHLQLVFEELMEQVLASRLASGTEHFSAEYSAADERIDVSASYQGDAIDVDALTGDLSYTLLCRLAPDIAFDDHDETHSVTLSIT